MDSVERRSATPGTKTGLATQTAQKRSVHDTNCDDRCSSARGEAKEHLADRHTLCDARSSNCMDVTAMH